MVATMMNTKMTKTTTTTTQQQQHQQQQQQQQQHAPPPPPPPPKARQAVARLAAFVASAVMHDAMIAYVPGAPLGYWSAFMLVQVPLLLAQDWLDARVTRWWVSGRGAGGGGGREQQRRRRQQQQQQLQQLQGDGSGRAGAGAVTGSGDVCSAAANNSSSSSSSSSSSAKEPPLWLRGGRVLATWALLALTTHLLLWPPVIDRTDGVYRVLAGAHGMAERAAWPLIVAVGGGGR
jgi:hypothetical protein